MLFAVSEPRVSIRLSFVFERDDFRKPCASTEAPHSLDNDGTHNALGDKSASRDVVQRYQM